MHLFDAMQPTALLWQQEKLLCLLAPTETGNLQREDIIFWQHCINIKLFYWPVYLKQHSYYLGFYFSCYYESYLFMWMCFILVSTLNLFDQCRGSFLLYKKKMLKKKVMIMMYKMKNEKLINLIINVIIMILMIS